MLLVSIASKSSESSDESRLGISFLDLSGLGVIDGSTVLLMNLVGFPFFLDLLRFMTTPVKLSSDGRGRF